MSAKNSHGVDVSKIKKGDRVSCNGAAYEDHRECIGGIVRKINISVIDVEGGWLNGSPRLYVRPGQIVRHIPADEPMPAPQPVRLDTETTIDVLRAAHAEELERVRLEAYRQGLQSAENQARHLATGCMGKSAEMLLALAEALEARRLEQLNKEARG